MIKHFCDICGEPASDVQPSFRLILPNMAWSGYKSSDAGGCQGTFSPIFDVRAVFNVGNLSKDNHRDHVPDLCVKCMIDLLENLTRALKPKLETPKES